MRVKVGDKVGWSEGGGEGPVVAMSKEWCIFLDETTLSEPCEIAIPWCYVYIPAEPGETVSAIEEMEV